MTRSDPERGEAAEDNADPADNEFTITRDPDGTIHCARPELAVTIMPDSVKLKAFHRNAIKWPGGRRIRWLVCELAGVRLYVQGNKLILTKRDLYP